MSQQFIRLSGRIIDYVCFVFDAKYTHGYDDTHDVDSYRNTGGSEIHYYFKNSLAA